MMQPSCHATTNVDLRNRISVVVNKHKNFSISELIICFCLGKFRKIKLTHNFYQKNFELKNKFLVNKSTKIQNPFISTLIFCFANF